MRSAYFCRMRSASALRFSNGCSSLNLERILSVVSLLSLLSLVLILRKSIEIVGVVAIGCCYRGVFGRALLAVGGEGKW